MPRNDRDLDAIDRKLLGLLTADAEQSYAALGDQVGLSPPAVHERVKRYKATGRIKGVVAALETAMTGKPLLAFIHVDTTGWGKSAAMMELRGLPEVEEIHSVTGDTCMLIKARMEHTQAMEGLLARLYDMPGVKSTKSYVALSTYLERPAQPGVTADLHDSAENFG